MEDTNDYSEGVRSTYKTVSLRKMRTHPWVRMSPASLFLAPVDFLMSISYPTPSECTDLGAGDLGSLPADEVWSRILQEGMNDPLIIIFSVPRDRSDKSATIRLESGNHRIRSARDTGFTHLPVVALLQASPLCHLGNGDHVYPFDRGSIDAWYRAGGRDPSLYDPYPHPVDLAALVGSEDLTSPIVQAFDIDVVAEGDTEIIFRAP